jgi:hypothetical protein
MSLADRRISARNLAETLDMTRERVWFIVMCWTWGNSLPNDRVVTSQTISEHSRLWQWRNVDTLVRSRDTRTIYRVEAQRFTSSTKFRTQKSASKVMASVFSDKYRILLVDCLERGATITASHDTPLLDKAVSSSAVSPGQHLLTRGCQYKAVIGWTVF